MRIKVIPEDFIVKEINTLPLQEQGSYSYFLLKKKGWSTIDAVLKIAAACKLKSSVFRWAGNKDKDAVTEQYISAYKVKKETLDHLPFDGIFLQYVGEGNHPLSIGELQGNSFIIVVRDLKKIEKLKTIKILNYFDSQRFGYERKNLKIGKALVKRNYSKACLILQLPVLQQDYIGALRKCERRTLLFCVHAYQSFLFNNVLEKIKWRYDSLPLVGYLTEFQHKDVKKLYEVLLKKEGITKDSFLFRDFPELSLEGSIRVTMVVPKNFSYRYEADELFPGKYKCILTFELPKGAYATRVVKELFKKAL